MIPSRISIQKGHPMRVYPRQMAGLQHAQRADRLPFRASVQDHRFQIAPGHVCHVTPVTGPESLILTLILRCVWLGRRST
jgi:hypothetical protein